MSALQLADNGWIWSWFFTNGNYYTCNGNSFKSVCIVNVKNSLGYSTQTLTRSQDHDCTQCWSNNGFCRDKWRFCPNGGSHFGFGFETGRACNSTIRRSSILTGRQSAAERRTCLACGPGKVKYRLFSLRRAYHLGIRTYQNLNWYEPMDGQGGYRQKSSVAARNIDKKPSLTGGLSVFLLETFDC